MSRRRYISTDISVDKRVSALAKEGGDFAVLLYILLIPHANDQGELTGNTEELLATVLPTRRDKFESDVEDALVAMHNLGLVEWDREQETLCLPSKSFYKYQTYIPEGKRKGAVITEPEQQSPKNAAKRRETPKNAAYPSPSPSLSLSPSPTEEEDAREALRPVADTQVGAIFPPDRPLPLLVQDFIQAKAGADAPRWEAELRLKLECKPLTGSPDSYMLGVLRGWVRDGGPPQPTPQRAQGGPRLTAAEERDARLKAERDADFEQMAEVERRLFADPWAVQEPEPPSLPAGRVRVSDAAFVRPTAPQGRRTGGLLQ